MGLAGLCSLAAIYLDFRWNGMDLCGDHQFLVVDEARWEAEERERQENPPPKKGIVTMLCEATEPGRAGWRAFQKERREKGTGAGLHLLIVKGKVVVLLQVL